jgi:hypothetical protein
MRKCSDCGVKKIMKILKQLVLLFTLLSFTLVQAQQDGVALGSFTLFPTLGVSFGYDDNVLYTNDDVLKLSSNYFVLSPGLRLEAEGEKVDFLAQYDYNKTFYNAESRYDFDMHHLLGSLGYNNSSRSKLRFSAEYYNGSDRIGTANQQGNIIGLDLDPDEWHSFGLSGKWHYGGVGAKGSIDLELGTVARDYDNNRLLTATRDRDADYFGITYSHDITAKTNLLAQFKRTNIDYEIASLDSTETRLMLGVEWQMSGKTSARALVGYLEKDFESNVHDDFSGVAVEAGLTWSPRSYSIFDLTLNRETDETNGNGSYVVRNTADLGWTHFWKNRFSTTANVGYSDEDYKGSFRNDNLNYYGLSAKYQFSEYIMSGLGFKHNDRNSSFDEFSYKDNSFLLTVELSK